MPNQIDKMTLEQMSCLIDSTADTDKPIGDSPIPPAIIIAQLEDLAKKRAANH